MFGWGSRESPLGQGFVTIEGRLDKAAMRRLDRDVRSIHINSEGAFGESLDRIGPWVDRIERLVVTDFGIEDVGAIMRMKNLRELDLWPSSRAAPDLSFKDLPKLEALAIDGGLKFTLDGAHSIRDLTVERARIANVVEVESMTGLANLRLMKPKVLPKKFLAPLTSLTIQSFNCRRVQAGCESEPLRGIEGLQRIRLDAVPGIADLHAFSSVKDIRWIYVDDCGDLGSLEGISLTPSTDVRLVGTTPARFDPRWRDQGPAGMSE